jgi:hypothetical protein
MADKMGLTSNGRHLAVGWLGSNVGHDILAQIAGPQEWSEDWRNGGGTMLETVTAEFSRRRFHRRRWGIGTRRGIQVVERWSPCGGGHNKVCPFLVGQVGGARQGL